MPQHGLQSVCASGQPRFHLLTIFCFCRQVTRPHEDASLAAFAPQAAQHPLIQRLAGALISAASAAAALGVPGLAHLHWPPTHACSAALRAVEVQSVVQIGAASGSYNANVTAAAGAQRCYAVPSYSSGALHHVVVGLGEEGPVAALSTYFYR